MDTSTNIPLHTEINSTGSVSCGCAVLLASGDMLFGHFSQVYRQAGFWTAVHEALETFHTHFYRRDTETQRDRLN